MKIAIMTQPLGHNYGGIMQAYALQKVLRNLGHEVITIDRQKDRQNIVLRALIKLKPVIYKILGKKIYWKLTEKEKKYIFSGMTSFLDKYVIRTEIISSNRKLIRHFRTERYDIVLVGSDQVWRPSYSANIYNYFLDFKRVVNNPLKGIAYAASFGVDEWQFDPLQTKKCRELMCGFSAVSVREIDAIKMCKEYLGVSSEVVLDPTLLLDRNEYMRMCGVSDSFGGKGVLRYILDDNECKSELVKEMAENLSMPIFSCQPASSLSHRNGKSLIEYKYPPVLEWLKSFMDADYVITDSFHGCVFAIIFNKPFLAIGNSERGLSRFTSLLSALGLMDRLILAGDTHFKISNFDNINWIDVNQRLMIEKEKSLEFINKWV